MEDTPQHTADEVVEAPPLAVKDSSDFVKSVSEQKIGDCIESDDALSKIPLEYDGEPTQLPAKVSDGGLGGVEVSTKLSPENLGGDCTAAARDTHPEPASDTVSSNRSPGRTKSVDTGPSSESDRVLDSLPGFASDGGSVVEGTEKQSVASHGTRECPHDAALGQRGPTEEGDTCTHSAAQEAGDGDRDYTDPGLESIGPPPVELPPHEVNLHSHRETNVAPGTESDTLSGASSEVVSTQRLPSPPNTLSLADELGHPEQFDHRSNDADSDVLREQLLESAGVQLRALFSDSDESDRDNGRGAEEVPQVGTGTGPSASAEKQVTHHECSPPNSPEDRTLERFSEALLDVHVDGGENEREGEEGEGGRGRRRGYLEEGLLKGLW